MKAKCPNTGKFMNKYKGGTTPYCNCGTKMFPGNKPVGRVRVRATPPDSDHGKSRSPRQEQRN